MKVARFRFAPLFRAAFSARRAFTSFRTSAAGRGLSALKRIVPLLVSYFFSAS